MKSHKIKPSSKSRFAVLAFFALFALSSCTCPCGAADSHSWEQFKFGASQDNSQTLNSISATDAQDVRAFEMYGWYFSVSGIGTNVVIRFEESVDGQLWSNSNSQTGTDTTITSNSNPNEAYNFWRSSTGAARLVRARIISISGGSPIVTFKGAKNR